MGVLEAVYREVLEIDYQEVTHTHTHSVQGVLKSRTMPWTGKFKNPHAGTLRDTHSSLLWGDMHWILLNFFQPL